MRATGRVSVRLGIAALAWSASAFILGALAAERTPNAPLPFSMAADDQPTGSIGTSTSADDAASARAPSPSLLVPPPGLPAGSAALERILAAPVRPTRATRTLAAVSAPADAPTSIAPELLRPSAPAAGPAASTPPAAGEAASGELSNAAFAHALEAFAHTEPPGAAELRLANPLLHKQHAGIAAFYALRGGSPLWVAGSEWTPQARTLIEFLAHAADDGLDLSAYAIPAVPGTADADRAAAELALSDAIGAYAFQASGGRVDPTRVIAQIGDLPNVIGATDALVDVAIAADPVAVLRGYEPTQPGYVALRHELQEIRARRALIARTHIPAGPALKLGMRDTRVSLIRARFGLEPSPSETAADGLVYDSVVATAVADFQRANGLPASGVLNSRTVAALSAGGGNVEPEVIANMERWRWMPRELPDDRIEVNVPDYLLRFYQNDTLVHEARVIVGKPDTPTPIFSNEMKYLTVNPSWYVPQSIIHNEFLPRLARDPNYLARQGYEVTRHGDTLTVRQPPGDRNALGHIVFWFPNQYAVYLHDTPTRGMFASGTRAFSHGCVRLENPFKFAEMVLGGDNGWTEQKLLHLVGSSEHYLNLPKPIPIYIVYFTAYVDEAGKLQLRSDVYGYSKSVQAALGLTG